MNQVSIKTLSIIYNNSVVNKELFHIYVKWGTKKKLLVSCKALNPTQFFLIKITSYAID